MNQENFLKWKEKRKAAHEKETSKLAEEKVQQMAGRKTGRQVFEENSAKLDDGDEDGAGDISEFLRSKREEEDRLDKENAALVEIMQKEMADLDKEGEIRVEQEIKQLQQEEKERKVNSGSTTTTAITTTTTATTTTTTATTTKTPVTNGHSTDTTTSTTTTNTAAASEQLQGVDTALFEEDEELPEFDGDDENEKNQE